MGDVSVQVAHRTATLAELKSGSIVLDDACGNGVVTLAIIDVEKPSKITIHATDLNPKICEVTAARVASSGWADSVTTAAMPSEALTFDDKFFSHSFTNFLLHLSKEPEKIVSNIYRTLIPGGTAIATSWATVAQVPAVLAASATTRGPDVFHAMKKGQEWRDPLHLEKVLKKAEFTEVHMEQCGSILAISDLRRWALIAWSFFGGMATGAWTEEDEGKFQQEVDIIHDTMLKLRELRLMVRGE